MSIIHLTDNDIQEYLDTKRNKEQVEGHILGCQECAVLLAEYEDFYTALASEETPQLSEDFVMQTMSSVKNETIALENNNGFYLYSLASLLISYLLVRYYVGYDFTAFNFKLPEIHNFFADWTLFSAIAQHYQASATSFNFLLFAGFILLFFAVVDSVLSKKHNGKVSSFSI